MSEYARDESRPLRTEFRDTDGRTIAVVECDNSDFLMALEGRVLGTRVQTEELDVWVASATVTQGGVAVMEYEPRLEPGS